jgi:hypothetical protein
MGDVIQFPRLLSHWLLSADAAFGDRSRNRQRECFRECQLWWLRHGLLHDAADANRRLRNKILVRGFSYPDLIVLAEYDDL